MIFNGYEELKKWKELAKTTEPINEDRKDERSEIIKLSIEKELTFDEILAELDGIEKETVEKCFNLLQKDI